VSVAVHRHVTRGRELRRRIAVCVLPGLPDADLNSGPDPSIVNFLHLDFAERAVAGVFDAVDKITNIGADPLQRAKLNRATP
jgi:hypothetical protein